MTKLSPLRHKLASLRHWRQGVRWGTGYSALITAVLWSLVAIFIIDVVFFKFFATALDVVQRLVIILLGLVGCVIAFRKYVRPMLGVRETNAQMAMLVERRHGIKSDLVAALQFESPEAATWGSPQLETSVIDYVSNLSSGLNVFDGFSKTQLARRGVVLAVTVLVLVGLAALMPSYFDVFLNRLCLGSRHYPTRVTIERVVVNQQVVLLRSEDGTAARNIAAAQGQPLIVTVQASGDDRSVHLIELQADRGTGQRIEILLEKQASEEGSQNSTYVGRLERMNDPVLYTVRIGDAWTDEATIAMVPLPVVQPRLKVTPPSYARSAWKAPLDPSARQLSVLESSKVQVAIESTNGKPLSEAWLVTKTKDDSQRYDLVKQDDQGLHWALPSEGTPFASVQQEVRFEIQAIDEHGLQPASPILGYIRMKSDRGPIGSVHVVRQVYLPTATPVIDYTVNDDYGISQILLHVDVEKSLDSVPSDEGETGPRPAPIRVLGSSQQLLPENLPYEGEYKLNLASLAVKGDDGVAVPLNLKKGDRIKLTFEVIDYRGDSQGESYLIEPLYLEIANVSDVISANAKDDERADKTFEAIKNKILE